MKTKINKKPYNFTANQKRRDCHKSRHYPIGKYLKTLMNRRLRRRNDVILRRNVELEKELPFIRHRKFLSWWVD